jgi:hypothetical protein
MQIFLNLEFCTEALLMYDRGNFIWEVYVITRNKKNVLIPKNFQRLSLEPALKSAINYIKKLKWKQYPHHH